MAEQVQLGALSLLPVVLALVLAFWTKNAQFSLLVGIVVGGVLAGLDPATGLARTFQESLGTSDFVWVMMIEVAVGVMIAFYLRSGVIAALAEWAGRKIRTRKATAGFAWGMGLFVFFSDYFSPLFAGPIARPLTDRRRISREMLAYLLDSGSAPVAALIPASAWAVYVASLMKGYGEIRTVQDGVAVFTRAVPFDFYGWIAVLVAGGVAFGLIPTFGPMRRAETRALKEGKVLRDGAVPLVGEELAAIEPVPGARTNLPVYLVVPVLIILGVALGTFAATGTARILEAFISAVLYQTVAMSFGGHLRGVDDGMELAIQGIKGVFPAIVILALAYCINGVSRSLGAQEYIVSVTQGWMRAEAVPAVTFLTAAAVSFFTGTSWGTYAILTPMVMPVVMSVTGGEVTTGVLATVGALVGGALFGDHCSPVSDTTCLSSFGAGSDHMDHVTTQLPFALSVAGVSTALAGIVGMLTL
ncbi:MAG: Na+/H+ antiporter NhaC family protein [Gemmatimonadota bacterium]|jgi:Na+/H+ antiporter NhaC